MKVYGIQDLRRILFYLLKRLKSFSSMRKFEFWEEENVKECQIWWIWRLFDLIYLVFGQIIQHYPGWMRRRIIVMQNPWVVGPQFWPFATYNIPQSLQNGRQYSLLTVFRWCFGQKSDFFRRSLAATHFMPKISSTTCWAVPYSLSLLANFLS